MEGDKEEWEISSGGTEKKNMISEVRELYLKLKEILTFYCFLKRWKSRFSFARLFFLILISNVSRACQLNYSNVARRTKVSQHIRFVRRSN